MILAEVLSLIVLTLATLGLLFPNGRLLDRVLFLSIIFIPVLVPSVASDMFLRGSVFRLVGSGILIASLVYRNRGIEIPTLGPLIFYLLFVAVCLVSASMSASPLESTLRVVTYLEPFAFFLLALIVAFNFADGFGKINKWTLLSLLIVGGYGIVQVITQRDFLAEINFTRPMSFLGNGISYINDTRTFSGRVTSFLAQPVYTAFFFIVASTVPLYWFMTARKKIIPAVIMIVLALLIYVTGTRAAYVVFVLILAFLIAWFRRRGLKIAVLVSVLAFVFLEFLASQRTLDYLGDSFDFTEQNQANVNALSRIDLTERLYILAQKSIWLGFGPGIIQKAATGGGEVSYSSQFAGMGGQENQYFTILADTGVLGLLAYVSFLVSWFYVLFKSRPDIPEELRIYGKILAFVSLGFFVGSLTVSNLTSVPMFGLFILYGGYIGALERIKAQRNDFSYIPEQMELESEWIKD